MTDPRSDDVDEEDVGLLRWLWRTDRLSIAVVRELLISVVIVLLIAGILFGISGVWPPLVAVESDSMEDQIMTGDMVFVVEADRFSDGDAIGETGVVPADVGTEAGYERFDRPGDVIIFAPNGDADETPIIHRAHYWVEEGEDWTDRANADRLGNADGCDDIAHCPAPHDGFITHGDNNAFYDQVQDDAAPVKDEWVVARAHLRIPLLGRIRLALDGYLGALVALPV